MDEGAGGRQEGRGNGTVGIDKRQVPRHDLIEFGMLWHSNGSIPSRLGPVMITNLGLGGVQIKTRQPLDEGDQLLLQLGSDDGPIFIPGDIRYVANGIPDEENGIKTFGFRFTPKTRADRQTLARYVLSLRDKVFANS